MMRKTVSLLIMAALMLSLMAGCAKQPPQESVQTEPPTAAPTQAVEQVELELPADERPYVGVVLQALMLPDADDPRAEVIRQAAEVFEARTGAKVEILWLHEDENLLSANLTSGVGVDIFATTMDLLGKDFLSYALDLTELAAERGYDEKSYPVLRQQVLARCGYLAGIPQEPLLYGMYYNADLFAEAGVTDTPNTWEEFLSLSSRLHGAGYMPLTIDAERAHLILEMHLERHLGAEQLRSVMGQHLWSSTNELIGLFRLPIEYAAAGYLAKGDPSTFPGGQNKIALSNVAMVAGSNELCGQVERSTMMDVNWGVFAYPGDGPGTGVAVESRVLAVHKNSENAQAAFDFIMLLTTGAFDQLYADVSEGIPADPANVSRIDGAQKLLNQADVLGIGLLNPEDNELFTRLWNGWYKTPSYFAAAMNGLAASYEIITNAGVG